MLLISEGIAALCSFLLIPVSSVQLSLGISGAVSNGINTTSLNNAIKKASNWILAVSSTVLLSVLSLQTIVSIPQDNIASKTAKFIIGSTVPVVGNTVSEAISTVRGCLKLLSASSVVYGVIAIALIVLPVIIELILWRGCMLLCSTVSEMLNFEKICALLKAIDNVLAFILGITVLMSVLFVISLTVISVL